MKTTWFKEAAPQLVLLAIAVIANGLISPSFFQIAVQDGRLFGAPIDVLTRGAPVMLVALGMALVIATRGVDLSVGAVMAIAGAVAAILVNAEAGWGVALAGALGVGLACGLWNGALVTFMGIEPIVATLILMVAGRGVAQLVTQGQIVTFTDGGLIAFGSGTVFGLPAPAVIAGGVLFALLALVRLTAIGLFVEAVGVNPQASRLAGVRLTGVVLGVYVIAAVLAALAGTIAAADIRAADSNNAGLWLELDAILAVVIGGGSLFGGRFSLSRVILGALVLQMLKTGILRGGLPPEFNLVVMAAAVAIVLCIQSPAMATTWARFKRQSAST